MLIKIWVAHDRHFPDRGPYRLLDTVNRDTCYCLSEVTVYGTVIAIPPSELMAENADQSVIVELDLTNAQRRSSQNVFVQPPPYNKVLLSPISVEKFWADARIHPCSVILQSEGLYIEDISKRITPDTFSIWKHDCYISKDTADALQGLSYAILHRYSTEERSDQKRDNGSNELIDLAAACLSLIRPTRKSRIVKVLGEMKGDGLLDPWGFEKREPVEVPEVQKLFKIRGRDIDLLRIVLPEFIQLYSKDEKDRLTDDFEPIRMAVQLYEQAYAVQYWKARHILWWAAIESLFGNDSETAMARIYAFFGNKSIKAGHQKSIYDDEDIPACFPASKNKKQTLGALLPQVYEVRNLSAHGGRVPDSYFAPVPHPFGQLVSYLDVMAEAVTFIIRKAVIEILRQGFRNEFRNRHTREDFWLYKYGLDRKQSKKRLQTSRLVK